MKILYLLVSLIALSIAVLPLFQGKPNKPKFLFAGIILASISWLISLSYLYAENAVFWARTAFIGPIIIPSLAITFLLYYPKKLSKKTHKVIPALTIGPILLLPLVYSPYIIKSMSPMVKPIYGLGHVAFSFYFVLSIAIFIGILAYRVKTETDIERLRLKYFLYGSFLASVYGIITNIVLPVFGIRDFVKFGPIGVLLFVSFTAYAMLRYQLLDIQIVIRRSVVYLVLLTTTFLITSSMIILGGNLFKQWFGLSQIATVFLASAVIVFVYPYLKDLFDQITDSIFFKRRFDYQTTLKEYSEKLSSLIEVSDILNALSKQVPSAMKVRNAAVYFRLDTDTYKCLATLEEDSGTAAEISPDHLLVKFLERSRTMITLLDLQEREKNTNRPEKLSLILELEEILRTLKAVIAIPILLDNKLVGIYLLGEKKSEDIYSIEDLILLETIAHQTHTAIQNALHYQNLQKNISDLSKLNEFSKTISHNFEVNQIYVALTNFLREMCEFEHCQLFLYDQSKQRLYVSDPTHTISDLSFPIEASALINEVQHRPFLLIDSQDATQLRILSSQLFNWFENYYPGDPSLLLVPLINGQKLVGAISTTTKNAGPVNTLLLSTISKEVAAAFDNALLYRQIFEMKIYNEEILQSMVNGIITTNADLGLTGFNKKAETLTGFSAENVLGRHISTLYSVCPDFDVFEKTAHTLSAETKESKIYTAANKAIPVSISVSSLKLSENQEQGVIGIVSDLSDIKNLQKQVEQANRLSSLGTLAAGIAHEIKNPLVAIKSFSQMLPSYWEDNHFRQRYIEVVTPQIQRIDNLCQSLLRLGKPQKPKLEFINMNEAIQEALSMLEGERKSCSAIFKLSLIEPSVICADRNQVIQIFVNLVINALHAMTQPGTGVVEISSDLLDAHTLHLAVKDTGVGIPKENIKKLFDPFFSTKKAGTGLGLSIVHNLVQEHHGKVEIESEINKGTTVHIYLPTNLEPSETDNFESPVLTEA